jgi:Mor family transcriptional regulator
MLEEIIAQAIGREDAQKAVQAIMDHWGGSLQQIPSGKNRFRERADRNDRIRSLYRNNLLNISSLADRFGLSESQVRKILGD